jgi:tripartite-type tricarboxylate transporter receptor subunit TctC
MMDRNNQPLAEDFMTTVRGLAAAALFGSALSCAGAWAQAYPNKPIRLIAPSSPGSGVDLVSRTLAPPLTAELGQQVVVDNRAGAGGNIGAEIAAKSPPNGYTLMMCTPSQVINAILHRNLSSNLLAEFSPISLASSGQFVLIVNLSLPTKTPAQFIQLAKAKPGGIAYGSAGQGNVTHLAGELFKHAAGVDLLHVPYKGSGPALVGLLGGQIQSMFANMAAAIPHIRSGKVHAIASTGGKRAGVTPDLPTFAESGVKGYEVLSWFGLVAPKGTPRDALARLHAAMLKVLRSADISERMSRDALDPVGSTPQEFAAYLDRESKQWERAVRIAGAKAE